MTRLTDMDAAMGLQDALDKVLASTRPLAAVRVPLADGLNRVVASDTRARVDSPSMDTSLMDGYAVRSSDLAGAGKDRPVGLAMAGIVAAGERLDRVVKAQQTLRVLTGAPIPSGADAVVPEELALTQERSVQFRENTRPGKHILPRGSDVAMGQVVARAGQLLTPGMLGLFAAAGHSHVQVVRSPEVAIIATGDEVILPGEPLPQGSLYASNLFSLDAWCRHHGFRTRLYVVNDASEDIYRTLVQCADGVDAVITSGGAWTGDRDLVAQVLHRLGWKKFLHGIHMLPGKGTGFGLLDQKPVFMLPGGPSANMMGFLQIALPGLLRLAGHTHTELPKLRVQLASDLNSRHVDWTQFVFGTLEKQNGQTLLHPVRSRSRLRSMAEAEAIVAIPEGERHLPAGTVIKAQILSINTGFRF
jgi:molybdopterin molybdotransferase